MASKNKSRRRFFVAGHTQATDTAFKLDDLSGGAGRLDVLARAVTSALCLSHGVRTDTEVWTIIDHEGVEIPRALVWHGDRLRNLNPDERSTAALFKKAFAHDAIEHFEAVHPGLEIAELGFAESLRRFTDAGPTVLLDKDGQDLRTLDKAILEKKATIGFVLSDHQSWTDDETRMLKELVPLSVSVGPLWLHGHQAITIVHDELDRRTK